MTPSVSGEREYPFLFCMVFNMQLVAAIAALFPCPVHMASTSTEESVDANAALFPSPVQVASTSTEESVDANAVLFICVHLATTSATISADVYLCSHAPTLRVLYPEDN